MRGTERRKLMLERLEADGSLSITELAAVLGVSKMTVHRDLDLLEKRGALRRIHGGAVLPKPGTPVGQERSGGSHGLRECMICFRPATQHLVYSMTLRDGTQRHACCPHCGISAQFSLGDQVVMALTADYLSGQLHSVQRSFFLYGSTAAPCCRPSILTFVEEENARRFQTGFGGDLGRFEDALNYLRAELQFNAGEPGCPSCAALVEERAVSRKTLSDGK